MENKSATLQASRKNLKNGHHLHKARYKCVKLEKTTAYISCLEKLSAGNAFIRPLQTANEILKAEKYILRQLLSIFENEFIP